MSHNPNCKHPGPHDVTCNCAVVELSELREKNGALRKLAIEAATLLENIEWAGSTGAAEDPSCPSCGGFAPVDFVSREPKGHTESCALENLRKRLLETA